MRLGRADKFYHWLQAKGAQIIEERDDAEIVYYTRHYALRDGVGEPERDSDNPAAGDLGYLKYGVFPGRQRPLCHHSLLTEQRA